MDVLLIATDQTVSVLGVQNKKTGAYINDATVTVTLYERSGAEVSGQTWPLLLDYQTSSAGNYDGNLEDGLDLIATKRYRIKIVVVKGSTKRTFNFWRYAIDGTDAQ